MIENNVHLTTCWSFSFPEFPPSYFPQNIKGLLGSPGVNGVNGQKGQKGLSGPPGKELKLLYSFFKLKAISRNNYLHLINVWFLTLDDISYF